MCPTEPQERDGDPLRASPTPTQFGGPFCLVGLQVTPLNQSILTSEWTHNHYKFGFHQKCLFKIMTLLVKQDWKPWRLEERKVPVSKVIRWGKDRPRPETELFHSPPFLPSPSPTSGSHKPVPNLSTLQGSGLSSPVCFFRKLFFMEG